jgi:tagatose-1,6-bisphosphate aldolase non-catalytic subunit AgaZ/GatZ
VLDGMVDAVFAEFHLPRVGGDWAEEMRARSRSGREVLKRHPWAVGLMDSRRGAGFETIRHHDAVIGCLREAGFSIPLTGHAFALLDAHLYGFLVQELSLPFEGEADLAEVAEQVMTAIPEGELPYFREFALEHALQPGYAFGDEFEVGLDLVIEGLARRLDAAS